MSKIDFLKYQAQVAYKAALDEVPRLSAFAGSESLLADELKIADDNDPNAVQSAKVRRALKNHLQAKKTAEEWKKATAAGA